MFYCTQNQQYIREGNPFEINGIQYPANWLNLSTPEEKLAIGLEEVVATNQPGNQQFYWVSETLNGAQLTYTNTPKELAPCQVQIVNQTKQTAYAILLPTDWMVVKAFETSTPIASDWNTWRQTIRTQAETYITSVNACTTIDELAALPQIEWALDPNHLVIEAIEKPVTKPVGKGVTNDPV
jgi:hypothetical protein